MPTDTLTQLDQLKQFTVVVADTGDFESMKKYAPRDATTNPSLILKAAQKPEYEKLVDAAVANLRKSNYTGKKLIEHVIDELLTLFGCEILKIVPGRVSTEVDASLSFDSESSIQKARELIRLYESKGIQKERILIKLASTWESVQAAKVLQKEGINCNMTLLFCRPQAVICAEAGAKLISPFVGRIYDWYKQANNRDYQGDEDPGVQSVKTIYNYYKHFDYNTEVMGASFRNKGEILSLAGCDLLTISPELLNELQSSSDNLTCRLNSNEAKSMKLDRMDLDEKTFRYLLNDDAMATEKLAQGIRSFAADILKLEAIIQKKIGA